jgi:hypothetical protein
MAKAFLFAAAVAFLSFAGRATALSISDACCQSMTLGANGECVPTDCPHPESPTHCFLTPGQVNGWLSSGCTKVKGNVYVLFTEMGSVSFPYSMGSTTQIDGSLHIDGTDSMLNAIFPALTTIGGDIRVYAETPTVVCYCKATLGFPVLTSVEGSIFVTGAVISTINFPLLTTANTMTITNMPSLALFDIGSLASIVSVSLHSLGSKSQTGVAMTFPSTALYQDPNSNAPLGFSVSDVVFVDNTNFHVSFATTETILLSNVKGVTSVALTMPVELDSVTFDNLPDLVTLTLNGLNMMNQGFTISLCPLLETLQGSTGLSLDIAGFLYVANTSLDATDLAFFSHRPTQFLSFWGEGQGWLASESAAVVLYSNPQLCYVTSNAYTMANMGTMSESNFANNAELLDLTSECPPLGPPQPTTLTSVVTADGAQLTIHYANDATGQVRTYLVEVQYFQQWCQCSVKKNFTHQMTGDALHAFFVEKTFTLDITGVPAGQEFSFHLSTFLADESYAWHGDEQTLVTAVSQPVWQSPTAFTPQVTLSGASSARLEFLPPINPGSTDPLYTATLFGYTVNCDVNPRFSPSILACVIDPSIVDLNNGGTIMITACAIAAGQSPLCTDSPTVNAVVVSQPQLYYVDFAMSYLTNEQTFGTLENYLVSFEWPSLEGLGTLYSSQAIMSTAVKLGLNNIGVFIEASTVNSLESTLANLPLYYHSQITRLPLNSYHTARMAAEARWSQIQSQSQ